MYNSSTSYFEKSCELIYFTNGEKLRIVRVLRDYK